MRVLRIGILFFFVAPVCAHAVDISGWSTSMQTHPAGTLYQQGDATVARYPMSSLDAANGGGLENVPRHDAEARMDWALAIIEMAMSDYEMTTLSGMPAAVGTVYTSDGERSFAAAFSGRVGSSREMLSVFMAPKDTFDAHGGMDVLADNRPRVGVNYAQATANAQAPKTTADDEKTATATVAKPRPKSSAPAASTPPAKKQSKTLSPAAARLLSGVRGDLNELSKKNAAERAIRREKEAAQKAAALNAKREQLYRDSGARKGHYPAPSGAEEFLVWPESGAWRVQVPNDKRSPRVATRVYEGASATPGAAYRAFVEETGLSVKGRIQFEPLESYRSLDGRDVQIALVETRRKRSIAKQEAGVAFVFYARGKDSASGTIRVMDMPADVYVDWGGVAGMLTLRRVIPGIEVFPASERERIAKSSLKEQVGFYEAVLDKFYMENALALMMTQAKTTEMMTELNYDLLFGNDITPGPWGD